MGRTLEASLIGCLNMQTGLPHPHLPSPPPQFSHFLKKILHGGQFWLVIHFFQNNFAVFMGLNESPANINIALTPGLISPLEFLLTMLIFFPS